MQYQLKLLCILQNMSVRNHMTELTHNLRISQIKDPPLTLTTPQFSEQFAASKNNSGIFI
jgi:hypothetical protein